ncbi:MAG: glycoside hydrolase family 10 protein [Bacteroidia bacterium]
MKITGSLLKLISVPLLLLLLSCTKDSGTDGSGNNPWDPNAMHGVWITTTASPVLDTKTAIVDAVDACKKAGLNNIFVVVYNSARTIYPSEVMGRIVGVKQMERFAGRDPLKELIDAAKAKGIKVHAWFEYGFAASYGSQGGPIIAAKPNWKAIDQSGKLVSKNGFEWLNAFDPEVQQFMLDLFKEVITKYAVDGVQGDDRLPALPSTGGYDPYTVALYKQENNGAEPPVDYKEANWVTWRVKKLNGFMKRLYTEVKALKPSVQVTMAPSPYPFGKDEYLQDWPTWVDSSWVDAVIPQCYRYDITAYTALVSQQRVFYRNDKIPLYPGVLLKIANYTATPGLLTSMIQANRNATFKGEVFFFYEGLPERITWFTDQYQTIQ